MYLTIFTNKATITFPPTYKYDIGTTIFDTRFPVFRFLILIFSEKNRCPSWTDRILWKTNLQVKPLRYTSFPSHVMSICL